MSKLSVDRIEGDYAVLEDDDEGRFDILMSELPQGCKEGDIIDLTDGVFTVDAVETEKRRKRISDLSKKLFDN